MEFFDTIRQVRSNWNPYKKWEIEQQKKEKQNEELRKKTPPSQEELEHAKQYGRTIVDVINTMDQHSIDKSEDASLMVQSYGKIVDIGCLAIFYPLNKLIKKLPIMRNNKKLQNYSGLVTIFLLGSAVSTTVQILQAKYEKQASRIARYQIREKDLKDYRHFVVYDNKQIKKAEEIAKNLPEVDEHKKPQKKGYHPIEDYKNAKITTDALKADNQNYEAWKKEYSKEEVIKLEKFKRLNPSQDELNKAEKDKEALLNTIKKIEASSLDYLNNISMAISIVMTGIVAGTYLLGHCTNVLLDKLIPKSKFLQGKSKSLMAIKSINLTIAPFIFPILLLGQTIKMQKDAARVGRFKAKQEMLNNPAAFISYSQEDRNKVNNIDNSNIKQKGFFAKITQDFKELKNYKKDYKEYQDYMKTKHKEELKLDEALKQVEISDKQKQNALQLQKKAFHSFEKMDEKAQRFTDDTDAAVDIVGNIVTSSLKTIMQIWGLLRLGNKATQINKDANAIKNIKSNELLKSILPFAASFFVHPIVNIIGTRIKKDAGKIGVMTAMKDLDDPKNFLDDKKQNYSEV